MQNAFDVLCSVASMEWFYLLTIFECKYQYFVHKNIRMDFYRILLLGISNH